MKLIKKSTLFFIIAFLFICVVNVNAQDFLIKDKKFDINSKVINKIVYIPTREILKALSFDYQYNPSNKTGVISDGKNILVITYDYDKALYNNKSIKINKPYIDETGVGMIPINDFCKIFKLNYKYTKSLVTINSKTKSSSKNNSKNTSKKNDNKVKNTVKIHYDKTSKSYNRKLDYKVNINGNNKDVSVYQPFVFESNMYFSPYLLKANKMADYSYNSKNKEITIKYEKNTLICKINSKSAKLNNKKITLKKEPRMVTNLTNNKKYTVVPISDISKKLGFNYKYSNGVINISDSYNLKIYDPYQELKVDYVGSLIVNDKNVDISNYPMFMNDGFVYISPYLLKTINFLDYKYNSTDKTVEIVYKDIKLELTLGDKIAKNNGKEVTLAKEPVMVYSKDVNNSYVAIPIFDLYNELKIGYEYSKNNSLVELSDRKEDENVDNSNSGNLENNDVDLNEDKTDNNKTDDINKNDKEEIYIDEKDFEEDEDAIYIDDEDEDAIYIDEEELFDTATEGGNSKVNYINKDNSNLILNIPSGISASNVSDYDNYFNNRFEIRIKGNYDLKNINNKLDTSKLRYFSGIEYSYNASNDITRVIFKFTKVMGYKYSVEKGKIYMFIERPSRVFKSVVLIDPGHGGSDSGAVGNGKREKDIVLDVGYKYLSKYFNSPNSQIKAYWTRKDDTFMKLYDRPEFTEVVDASLFVSIHANSASSSATGLETYYSSDNKSKNNGITSKYIATKYLNSILKVTGLYNRGVKDAGFVVVRKNTVPATLIELGFITNKKDVQIMTTKQDAIAKAIYDTTVEIFNEINN